MQTELNKVITALHEFYAHEAFLLEKEAGERALTHRLAVHFEKQFPGWEIDCEYDRLRDHTPPLPPPAVGSAHAHLRTYNPPRRPHAAPAARVDRLDRRSPRQIHLSRHRGAPARHSQQPARRRGTEIGQSPAART